MNNLAQIRQAYADTLRQASEAEQQATQARATASSQRQVAGDAARRQNAQARQQVESITQEIANQYQQADRTLADLKLTPGRPAPPPYQPYGATSDQLLYLLQNHAAQARDTMSRIQTTALALKAEQRKWWKFW